ncbi:cellulose binding domain-containing protein [Streptomyces sp. ISL-96]|uniref:GH12 family glycosyl hydrolase domain-containing protein n=1 Tax=Streptomyces sp. ISL-96 TaxID=2819191 RepID=UPI001BEBE9F7|nr:cellulose binding domain-containing protein [Streptomyces sp. ISL-96]MBT2490800.1 cellulose binding domain-containing protein [Streptomyces sp. ISL-96]
MRPLPLPHCARSVRTALMTMLVALASLAALVTTAGPAQADTLICDQFGSTTIQGRYVVQNNRWGTSATQCVNATATGFELTRADGSVPTNGAPKSYPSIYNGCHYTNCSPGTNLPKQVSTISSAPSSISYGYVSNAVYNASYDIWLDPTPKTDGVSRTEIMIWFNRVGPIQPIGSKTGTASVGGRTWDVWTGSNGSNDVISFIAPSAIASWSFDVMDFVDQTVARGMAQPSWYITSVQAGFEPWQNGAGLRVDSFSSTINSGSTDPGDPGDPGTPAACKVTYATNVWPGGFTANVSVANTGSAPVNGWKVAFTLPSGQSVTNAWNATIAPSSGAVTASNTSSNAQIAPNGSQSFGFQGTYTGTFTKPTQFSLNGTACTVV